MDGADKLQMKASSIKWIDYYRFGIQKGSHIPLNKVKISYFHAIFEPEQFAHDYVAVVTEDSNAQVSLFKRNPY